jgi:homoserine O-acetyltransferase
MSARWLTKTEICRLPLPEEGFSLRCGDTLAEVQLAYEAYGTLNEAGNNAIFICHALTGDAHAAGWHTEDPDERPGWWDELIGPGKPVDTDKYYVVCTNILGGCKGSTGPASNNPKTGKPFGAAFPRIAIADTVAAERILLEVLGIKRLYAVIGGSMGGMRALQWAVSFPDFVERCVCVASAAHLNTQALAFDVIGRNEIEQDPNWCSGDYYDNDAKPDQGLARARQIGHVTYLSSASMRARFGREKRNEPWPGQKSQFSTDFQVESYLAYQGQKFVNRFDANSYLYVTHMMDMFDLPAEHGGLDKALASVKSKFLVVAVSSDWLFPPLQQLEIVTALLANRKEVSFFEIDSDKGHDAFLLEYETIGRGVEAFLTHEDDQPQPLKDLSKRQDAEHIRTLLPTGSRVLDVGSGPGDLLHVLAAERNVTGICVDRDFDAIVECLRKGLSAIQLDADKTLPNLPSDAFDCVLLNQTIQQLHSPLRAIREMLRVAPTAVIGFPNFAYYRYRWSLLCGGRLPKSETLPFEWYDTPNIHLVTTSDFQELCHRNNIAITEIAHLADCGLGNFFLKLGLDNLGSERAIVQIARS